METMLAENGFPYCFREMNSFLNVHVRFFQQFSTSFEQTGSHAWHWKFMDDSSCLAFDDVSSKDSESKAKLS